MRSPAEEIKEASKKKRRVRRKKPIAKPSGLLSTGSTLVNLACSNNPFGGFPKGTYTRLVGDSTSGKTFLGLTCFAEAARDPHFKHYRLIFDDVERRNLFNMRKLFGNQVAERVEPPGGIDEDGEKVHSFVIEDFYYHLDDLLTDCIKNGKPPFIYVLDSMDALSSKSELDKFDETKDAHRKGKKTSGSYGDGKAKVNSAGIRKIVSGLQKTGSIVIILSQTRDNIGFGFNPKTSSGGKALKFYAVLEIWTSVVQKLKKTVKKKRRTVGVRIKVDVQKNGIVGWTPDTTMEIYPSYGIDDMGSCVDYLLDEGWWEMGRGKAIDATEFEVQFSREKLIKHIEENKLQKKLQTIVGKCWKEVLEACSLDRPGKYSE